MKTIVWQNTNNFNVERQSIHIWQLDIEKCISEANQLILLLDEKEKARLNRFRFANDQKRFVITHGKLRMLLSSYLGCSPQDIIFQHNAYGKPSIVVDGKQSELTFNLSHRHDRALIAITKQDAIGIDIERVDEKDLLDDIVGRFFSRDEQEEYSRLPDAQKTLGFYLAWTRKEAFIKAMGKGMMYALHNFSVNLTPDELPRVKLIKDRSSNASDWQMHSFMPEKEYYAALCWKGRDKDKLFFKF